MHILLLYSINAWAAKFFLHVENHTLFNIKNSTSANFSKDTVQCNYRNPDEATCHDGTDVVCVSVYVHLLCNIIKRQYVSMEAVYLSIISLPVKSLLHICDLICKNPEQFRKVKYSV